jgi:hypothetical protein
VQYGLEKNGSGFLKHEIHGLYKIRNGSEYSFFLTLRPRACSGNERELAYGELY